ncbi:hypothetical protein pb186bvf_004183 [Paramecium bursaria]
MIILGYEYFMDIIICIFLILISQFIILGNKLYGMFYKICHLISISWYFQGMNIASIKQFQHSQDYQSGSMKQLFFEKESHSIQTNQLY